MYRLSHCLLSTNIKHQFRTQLTRNASYYAIKLSNKQMVRVSGRDSVIYLQTLLTNDMRHLLPNQTDIPQRSCIYAYFLNAAGRVLCDLMVYRGKVVTDGEFLLEVDQSLANALRRVLKGYNLWPDVRIEPVKDVHLWAIIPKIFRNDINFMNEIISDDLQLVQDPRTPLMGYRLLSRIGGQSFADVRRFIEDEVEELKLSDYRLYRYRLGITEGYDDLWSGYYYPFECNGDYLNAVSVTKGLYLSEEKAFKIYTTKPIVKRIMPIKFECDPQQLIDYKVMPKTFITSARFGEMGRIINLSGCHGIASLKCREVYKDPNILYHHTSNIKVKVWKPDWWPLDVWQIHMPQIDYMDSLFNVVLLANEKPNLQIENSNPTNVLQ